MTAEKGSFSKYTGECVKVWCDRTENKREAKLGLVHQERTGSGDAHQRMCDDVHATH